MGLDAVKSAADKFEKWDPLKNKLQPTTSLPAATTIKGAALTPPPMPAMAPSGASASDTSAGPATQALYDKQAAKAAAYRDYSAKLKAIEEGTVTREPAAPGAAKPAAKPRAAKAVKPAAPSPGTADAKPARRSPAKKPREKKADPV
jgi:sec-independent protein translocase protein TatB